VKKRIRLVDQMYRMLKMKRSEMRRKRKRLL
jgi:hypothetical protein